MTGGWRKTHRPLRHQYMLSCAALLWLVPTGCPAEEPQVRDTRLRLTLYAEHPEIVTPIGLAIDADDRLFVLESHTHHPPEDYDGPSGDVVKMFVDADGDGRADPPRVFAAGLQQAMNLALHPDGTLYAVCARHVVRLPDENRDGQADAVEVVLTLETRERYAHNSLLGIAFDADGSLYLARGNTGSHAYRMRGPGGSEVSGYGDGGSVIRCLADGSQLQSWATGFWNPFDLTFDGAGRLLLVDNDPDARGPNRLLQVVRGGDYGYKSLYGGSGNHPFQGWDGEMPGTLPFLAGTGEAPSGLLDGSRTSFPREYQARVLVTSWNENSLEMFDLREAEGHLRSSEREVLIQGGKNFRPVALECDRQGNLFLTDWVRVDYPNHGAGRIWKLFLQDAEQANAPRKAFDRTSHAVLSGDQPGNLESLRKELGAADPFARHRAILMLSENPADELFQGWAKSSNPRIRQAVLEAARRASWPHADALAIQFLEDPDEVVRWAALLHLGQSGGAAHRAQLGRVLRVGKVTPRLFTTYLAAHESLDDSFVAAHASQATPRAKELPRRADERHVLDLAQQPDLPPSVRALAVGAWSTDQVAAEADWLWAQVRAADDALARASLRQLQKLPFSREQADGLWELAQDEERELDLRLELLAALAPVTISEPVELLHLLKHEQLDVAVEAARTLRSWLDAEADSAIVEELRRGNWRAEVSDVLAYALGGTLLHRSRPERPEDQSAWQAVLATGGVARRGRQVFFSGRVGCARCHTIDGRGGMLGPDLSGVAQSKSRAQIIEAILDPSAGFAPQYQAWAVITTDGQLHRGLQLDHKAKGAIALVDEQGASRYFPGDTVESYAALPSSLMPAGLADTMSVTEFRDLIAFLEQLP